MTLYTGPRSTKTQENKTFESFLQKPVKSLADDDHVEKYLNRLKGEHQAFEINGTTVPSNIRPRITAGFEPAEDAPNESLITKYTRFHIRGAETEFENGVYCDINSSVEHEVHSTAKLIPLRVDLIHMENTGQEDKDIELIGMKGNSEFILPEAKPKLGSGFGKLANVQSGEGTDRNYSFTIPGKTAAQQCSIVLYNRHHELDPHQIQNWMGVDYAGMVNDILDVNDKDNVVTIRHSDENPSPLITVLDNMGKNGLLPGRSSVSIIHLGGESVVVSAPALAIAIKTIKEGYDGMEFNAGLGKGKICIRNHYYKSNAKPISSNAAGQLTPLLDLCGEANVRVSGYIRTEYYLCNDDIDPGVLDSFNKVDGRLRVKQE